MNKHFLVGISCLLPSVNVAFPHHSVMIDLLYELGNYCNNNVVYTFLVCLNLAACVDPVYLLAAVQILFC